ncbi:hypothetical protein BH20GEM2_BH20GEM2_16880 [soil metagenome]
MRSTTSRPRNESGQFLPLATDRQVVFLQDLAKSGKVGARHRINIRKSLKRYVTRAEATREITRLARIVRAA